MSIFKGTLLILTGTACGDRIPPVSCDSVTNPVVDTTVAAE